MSTGKLCLFLGGMILMNEDIFNYLFDVDEVEDSKKGYKLSEKEQRMSDELFKQVHKQLTFNNKRQAGSGIAKYRSAMRSFCDFVTKEYRMRNLRNISNRHLSGFVEYRQNLGIKDIKTELAAIRKFHKSLENPRYTLENDNLKLGVERVKNIEDGRNIVDRAWTDREFQNAVQIAIETGNADIANAFEIARNFGLRINEVTALTKSQINKGLQSGAFIITHSKGGIRRTAYVDNARQRECLKTALKHAKSERIFQGHGRTHEQAKIRIQNFIYRNRGRWSEVKQNNIDKIDAAGFRTRKNLSFHGLRHSFARDLYRERLNAGLDERQARYEVAQILGHGRDEVTKIYL